MFRLRLDLGYKKIKVLIRDLTQRHLYVRHTEMIMIAVVPLLMPSILIDHDPKTGANDARRKFGLLGRTSGTARKLGTVIFGQAFPI